MTGVALALWLSSLSGTTPEASAEPEHAATAIENVKEPARFRAALESSAMSFPSGPADGGQDVFLVAFPIISFEGGGDFALALGAPLRLRVFDDPPINEGDHEGLLRAEDWDQLSDFGQVLGELKLGADSAAVTLRVGPINSYTLGSGQLISRYSNRTNPNYHPAGARAVVAVGATRIEAFASDVLGGRILAAEVAVDAGRVIKGDEAADRYHLALSAVHDFARAGGATGEPLSLGWLEGSAALLREERVRMAAYLGVGARSVPDGSSVGATLGLAAEGEPTGWRVGGRVELRKLNGTFRPGMIGHDFELARFSAVGLAMPTVGSHALPDSFSFRAEATASIGGDDPDSQLQPGLVLSASGEHFTFGRDDVEVAVSGRALDGRGALGVRAGVTGFGQAPRFMLTIESRYRFAPSFYAVASGGTVFTPQEAGGLGRGYYAGAGVGMDFER